MPFKAGQAKHPKSGRQPGVVNKKKIIKISELLILKDINPVEEMLKLIPELNARDQMETWKFLLSYLESKPKSVEVVEKEESDSDIENQHEVLTENLLNIVKK